MKITVDRYALAESFLLAAAAAPTKSPKEVLQNVKIVANEDSLTFTATDMEVSLTTKLTDGLIVEKPGAILLPVTKASGILRESNSDTFTIETDENGGVRIEGKGTKYRLPSIDPDEFPSVSGFGDLPFASVTSASLLAGMSRTAYAADSESSRYALGGVKVEESDSGGIIFVGTDGRRMATQEIDATLGGYKFPESVIVPSRAIAMLQKALSRYNGECKIRASMNEIHVEAGPTTINARLVEGRYPTWKKVIPEGLEEFMSVETSAGVIMQSVRQASIMTNIDSRGIDLSFSSGNLTIEASTSEIGDSKVEMAIVYDGEPVKITLDHRYVLDICKVLDAEAVMEVQFKDDKSPMVLTTNDKCCVVLMPMSRS